MCVLSKNVFSEKKYNIKKACYIRSALEYKSSMWYNYLG